MFTGIVEEIGKIRRIQKGSRSATLHIAAATVTDGLKIGDSVAVNGVCLTVTACNSASFAADVMPESLKCTALAELKPNSPVNLERALAAGGRFGGHIVSGHVDGVGTITDIAHDDNALWYTVAAAPRILRYIVEKGSVALDGISLTVAQVSEKDFAVSVIPHTAAATTLGGRQAGDTVNLENDIIGKYVEKLLQASPRAAAENKSRLTADFLAENGFLP